MEEQILNGTQISSIEWHYSLFALYSIKTQWVRALIKELVSNSLHWIILNGNSPRNHLKCFEQ